MQIFNVNYINVLKMYLKSMALFYGFNKKYLKTFYTVINIETNVNVFLREGIITQ
jgi:hypothetical protein